MKKLIYVLMISCMLTGMARAGMEAVPRLRFVCRNGKPDVQSAQGPVQSEASGEQVITEPGQFGDAMVFEEGMRLSFSMQGNIDRNEGTLSCWFKPFSDYDDGRAHVLFEASGKGEAEHERFVLTKGWTDTVGNVYFYFADNPPWNAVSFIADKIWKQDEWIHLAATWSRKAGKMAVYHNGRRLHSAVMKAPERLLTLDDEGTITIGGCENGTASLEGAIEELAVYDGCATDEEIWTLFGGSGEMPPPADGPYLDYENVPGVQMARPDTVALARPLQKGKIRGVFFVPFSGGYDVTALAQLLDLEARVFPLSSVSDGSLFYLSNRVKQYYKGTSDAERLALALSLLDEKPDVIAILGVRQQHIPADVLNKIYGLVEDGSSSLLLSGLACKPDSMKTELQDEAEQICRLIPRHCLTDFYEKCFQDQVLPVRTGMFGKGRVALLNYAYSSPLEYNGLHTFGALLPPMLSRSYSENWPVEYHRLLLLPARIVQWLAYRCPEGNALALPADGTVVTRGEKTALKSAVRLEGHNELTLSLEDRWGHEVGVHKHAADGAMDVEFEIPVLAGGEYMLKAEVRDQDGAVKAWGATSIIVEASVEIAAVELAADCLESGEKVCGSVRLSKALISPCGLEIKVRDNYQRIIYCENHLLEPGAERLEFACPVQDSLTECCHLDVRLLDDRGLELFETQTDFFIRLGRDMLSPDADEFASIVWGFDATTADGYFHTQKLLQGGFNAFLVWPDLVNLKNLATLNMHPAIYATHIVMKNDADEESWANPSVRQKYWKAIEGRLNGARKYSPLFYSLGDEDVYGDELGYSPSGMKFYAEYLEKKYGSIETLNRVWGDARSFKTFSEVPRWSAGQRSDLPASAYVDHREALEAVWRTMFTTLRENLKAYDSQAIVGAEGSETNDLEEMIDAMDFWAPYSKKRDDVFQRDMRNALNGHWHGAYCELDMTGNKGLSYLWRQLFNGFSNASFFFSSGPYQVDTILRFDNSFTPFFEKYQKDELLKIQNGVGQLLRRNAQVRPQVMLFWSTRSKLYTEIDRAYGSYSGCDGKLIKALENLQIPSWGYITSKRLKEMNTIPEHTRLVILPMTVCLDDSDAAILENFVRNGGILLTIGPAGLRNGLGEKQLNGRLGAMTGETGQDIEAPVRLAGGELLITWPDGTMSRMAIRSNYVPVFKTVEKHAGMMLCAVDGNYPLMTWRKIGNGQVFHLACNAERLAAQSVQELLKKLLDLAGVNSPVRFVDLNGRLLSPGDNWGWLERRNLKLLGLNLMPEGWNGGTVLLSTPQFVYDVLAEQSLGYCSELKLEGENNRVVTRLFALMDKPLDDISVACPAIAVPGEEFPVDVILEASGVSLEGHAVRMDFQAPDGRIIPYYRKFFYSHESGECRPRMHRFALNDQQGEWTVMLTDIATGVTAQCKCTLKK